MGTGGQHDLAVHVLHLGDFVPAPRQPRKARYLPPGEIWGEESFGLPIRTPHWMISSGVLVGDEADSVGVQVLEDPDRDNLELQSSHTPEKDTCVRKVLGNRRKPTSLLPWLQSFIVKHNNMTKNQNNTKHELSLLTLIFFGISSHPNESSTVHPPSIGLIVTYFETLPPPQQTTLPDNESGPSFRPRQHPRPRYSQQSPMPQWWRIVRLSCSLKPRSHVLLFLMVSPAASAGPASSNARASSWSVP